WSIEARAALRELAAVLSGERRRVRHAAMLEAGAAPGDTFAAGGGALSPGGGFCASEQVRGWCRPPRTPPASAAAPAVAASPLLLVALMVEAVAGRHAPDLVSPLVARLYNQERLSAARATAVSDLGSTAVQEPAP